MLDLFLLYLFNVCAWMVVSAGFAVLFNRSSSIKISSAFGLGFFSTVLWLLHNHFKG